MANNGEHEKLLNAGNKPFMKMFAMFATET